MEFSLPEFPSAPGAQAAFVAAAIALVFGLVLLVFPGFSGRFLGLQSGETRPAAIGELRAAGGFLAGLALATLMFDQPVLYTALGTALAISAFGRILSLMSDRAATFLNFLLLAVQIVLAGATLYYFFEVFTPEMQFTMPQDMNATLVFYTYAAFAVIGALMMFAPRIACMTVGLEAITDTGSTSMRSAGGFTLGAALIGMAAANPMMDLGFGAALAIAVIGRVIALILNRGNYIYQILALLVQGAAAALVISTVMGMM
ncbi:MAG: hypothetical protein JWM58_1111 [Rhizobium sp.]|nr:hypothetical protein [Rhizobium sp.]